MWYVKEIEESKVIPILRMELLSTKRRLWWNSFWEKKLSSVRMLDLEHLLDIQLEMIVSWIYKNGFQQTSCLEMYICKLSSHR